jgi:putative photosynthetic complex assembly protein
MNERAPVGSMKPPIRKPIGYLLAFLGVILLVVAFARFQGLVWTVQDAPVLWQRELVFSDTPDGQILVLDYSDSKEVARFKGEQGFLRGTLRALARERKRRGIGSQAPFRVIEHTDGRLTLLDPSTAQRIDLESFGPVNSAIFRNFKKL